MIDFTRPFFWKSKNFLSYLLLPFSYLYQIIFELSFFFNPGYKSSIKTICVGSYTIGGAGKTPAVISICNELVNKSKKVCIISRGYKGSLEGPVIVDDKFHNFKSVGDEALLLAKYFPTIISKNKLEAIKFAEKEGFEIAVFDDGMQNSSIDYDFKVVIYDQNSGNKLLLPAGPLREKEQRALFRSNIILSSYSIPDHLNHLSYKWVNFSIYTDFKIKTKSQDFILFSGIGNNEKFFDFAKDHGIKIVKKISFSDHHDYKNSEIEEIVSLSKKMNAKILTTEKDFVKIGDDFRRYITFLPIYYRIDNLEILLKKFYENH